MSALPIPPSVPQSIPTNIRAFCKTPASIFDRLLDMENYTELRCLCLTLVETVGYHQGGVSGRKFAEISMEQWKEATSIKENETIHSALASLIDTYRLIKTRTNERGRTEYAVCDELLRETKGVTIRGRCPDCKTVGTFSTEYIPVIHLALRKMGACVDPATFKVVMLVIRFTMKQNRERGLWMEPYELTLADFENATGLDRRELSNGLSKAKLFGLISRRTEGIRSWYWVNPEAFSRLEQRGPRLVTQPPRAGKTIAQKTPTVSHQNPKNPKKTHATESAFKFGFQCVNCRHFVDPEPVVEVVLASEAPEQPPRTARAGPIPKKPPSKQDQAWEILENLYKSVRR